LLGIERATNREEKQVRSVAGEVLLTQNDLCSSSAKELSVVCETHYAVVVHRDHEDFAKGKNEVRIEGRM